MPNENGDHPQPVDIEKLLDEALDELRLKTTGHVAWGLGTSDRWDLDQKEGILRFIFSDGRVAEALVQVIGTYSASTSIWMWAWANPSIEPSLTKDARTVRDFGRKHDVELLTSAEVHISEERAWTLAALAVKLNNQQGAYRGPAGDLRIFMSFGKVRISSASPTGTDG